jgi:ABC-type sugar transport system ATPase subunit
MDEPTASLHRQEIRSLFEIIRGLRNRDVAVLYISHHLEEVFEVADRVTVLRDGVVAGERSVAQTSAEDLISLIFGQAVQVDRATVRRGAPPRPGGPDNAAAEMKDVHYRAVVHGVSLSVFPGEILAITGNQGSGASEVAQLLAGVVKPSGGEIHHAGRRPGRPPARPFHHRQSPAQPIGATRLSLPQRQPGPPARHPDRE